MGEESGPVSPAEFDRLSSAVSRHEENCVKTRDWMRFTERERSQLASQVQSLTQGLFLLALLVAVLLCAVGALVAVAVSS